MAPLWGPLSIGAPLLLPPTPCGSLHFVWWWSLPRTPPTAPPHPPPSPPSLPYIVLLSNANNTPRSTADFKGLVFSYRYPNFPKTDVFLFRSGRFTTAARGWNTWAFRGCYPNWDGSNTVWFQPPERC